MSELILKKSEDANINYLAIISKVSVLKPIENADRLCTTVLNGYDIIVPNTTNIGDIVVFFPMESCICEKYLSINNLYGIGDYDRNANVEEVQSLIDASLDETDADKSQEYMQKAKSKVGFFNKHGRVTRLKLRGAYSFGLVMPILSLEKVYPELVGTNWENLIGTEFNMVGNEKFCWKYVPKYKGMSRNPAGSRQHRRFQRRMVKFDRIIPEQFVRHYETAQINKTIRELYPNDIITVTVKCHGSSGIFANILCNRQLTWWEKVKKFFGAHVETIEYGNVYSSRNVIKNQYINKQVTPGFYEKDAWAPVNEMLKPHIVPGMTVYGEIVGYVEGTDKPIQKKHDYGCEIGEWKFLPYRITTTSPDGRKYEWNVCEVDEWTRKLVTDYPELKSRIMYFEILYHGKFADLYPDLDPESETWYDDVLERMKNEKRWGMEEKEPLCHRLDKLIAEKEKELSKVKKNTKRYKELDKELKKLREDEAPREGVVIRVDNDMFPRAWKLKTQKHYDLEHAQHDAGEVDMEEEN
jgi:hypothetical protein